MLDDDLDGAFVSVGHDGQCYVTRVPEGGRASDAYREAVAMSAPGPRSRTRTILYVNGVQTTPAAHCKSLRAIAAASGSTVVGVYNSTEGIFRDLAETGGERRDNIPSLPRPPADWLEKRKRPAPVSTLTQVVEELVADGKPVPEIWAHSQGGAIAGLALSDAEARGTSLVGLRVVTFASASREWASGPWYEHYVHTLDVVPRVFGLGLFASSYAKQRVVYFSGDPTKFDDWRYGLPRVVANHDFSMYLARWRREHKGGASGSW